MHNLRRLVLLLVVWAIPLASSASVVLRLSFADLVSQASAIVHARVVSQQSRWEGPVIATYVQLEVIDGYKGEHQAGERLVIYQHGGTADGLTMMVPGEPHFVTGEEVLLFLEERTGGPEPLVLGMAQGRFTVVTEEQSGLPVVTRSLDGLELVEQDQQLMQRFATPSSPVEADRQWTDGSPSDPLLVQPLWIPLDQFTAEIERLVRLQEAP